MRIAISGFQGESPRTIPRILPTTMAQQAYNTKLDNGAINPIHRARFVHHLDQEAQTIYLHKGEWISWDAVIHAAPGPVADDRLYYTGDGAPKMRYDAQVYNLAIALPDGKPVASVAGTPDPQLLSSIIYAYTWVTDLGEESEPSPLSDSVEWSPGLIVTVRGFSVPPANRRVTMMRIYRSQTSSTGATELYFIAERPAGVGDFIDDNLSISELIPSTDWNAPPDDLQGLTPLPNGMMAAFVGKKLYFCEPYRPHAWPEKYVLTMDYEIVGLGAFGSSVAIMTTGTPYIASGTAPENMVPEKLELNLPCVNARSIVDLGYAVAYASNLGLVSIGSGGASVVSNGIFTRDQWKQMNPYSFVAGQYAGRWMASYAYTDESGEGQRRIIIIDLSGDQPFVIRNTDYAASMFYDIETGALYLLKGGNNIYEWDAISEPFGEQLWRSKKFVINTEICFGALLVEGDDTMTAAQKKTLSDKAKAIMAANKAIMDANRSGGEIGGAAIGVLPFGGSLLDEADFEPTSLAVSVYADGVLRWTTSKLNQVVRLPGGYLARTWEIEVRGNIQISNIIMAISASEIAEGA